MIARGCVRGVHAGLVELALPMAELGASVVIETEPLPTPATIVALSANGVAAATAHGSCEGTIAGMGVRVDPLGGYAPLGCCALGRAIDGLGRPLDGGVALRGVMGNIHAKAPTPEDRRPIARALWTGVRTIDTLLTIGIGARVGIFGAPGLGKSTLLETIVRGARCDAVVVALIGERGREAQQWIEGIDERTTVLCATSDRPASERLRAAELAMAQAEALRSRGLDVLLLFDSLARYAAAARELAVATGERVGRAGFPPSVVGRIASLLERSGSVREGSITLIATVLNDGDDRDPVSEAARSLLDGHIQLDAERAAQGRYPAIDVPASVSRTMRLVAAPSHVEAAQRVRSALAALARTAEARSLGIDSPDLHVAAALRAESALNALQEQGSEPSDPQWSLRSLQQIADTLREPDGYFD